jgi:periplasmic divalent cation tolerance protein
MPDIIQIVTTIDDREAAERMGKRLVGERLVACCQIVGPIRSIYRWKGNVEEADEWYCVMKTSHPYRQVEGAIKRLHPYEFGDRRHPVSTALPDYARWVESETS